MSKQTAATSTEIAAAEPMLMLAFVLGETGWLLGFSAGYGDRVLRRKIVSRDTAALERESVREAAPGPALRGSGPELLRSGLGRLLAAPVPGVAWYRVSRTSPSTRPGQRSVHE